MRRPTRRTLPTATPQPQPPSPDHEARRRRDRVLDWLGAVPEWFTRAKLAWMVLAALCSLGGLAVASVKLVDRVDQLETITTRLDRQYLRIEGWLSGIGAKLHVDEPKAGP